MMDTRAFFPNRVRPVGDALAGLARGLQNLSGLIACAGPPTIVFLILVTAANTILAIKSRPYFFVAMQSWVDWWIIDIIYWPFAALVAYRMLQYLWFGSRPTRCPVTVVGIDAVWLAASWFVAHLILALNERIYRIYTGQFENPSLYADIASIQILETVLHIICAAGAAGLLAAASLASPRTRSEYDRNVIIGLSVTTAVGLAILTLLVHAQNLLLGDDPVPSEWLNVLSGVILITCCVLLAASTRGWFERIGHTMLHAGWRLAALLLIGAALANASGVLLDAVYRWAGLTSIRIDDPYYRAEFVLREFTHHALPAVKAIVYYAVLLSITAEGFRRILGLDLRSYADPTVEATVETQPA